MTARSALHAVVQHASDADEAEFNRRLDAYAAEVRGAALQNAKAETVAWLAKKAGEHRARGRQYAKQADIISVLASKADRGAIRCFLGDAPLLRELTDERDRARRIAVALEQEVAELTRRLAEVPRTEQCGHDDYHDPHPWADQEHVWCPGHNYEADE
ncbi:hypothetical protein [Streptomyces sp. Iso 434]|uniref:hypothetical protein n=1 Tax=Streptomyces sp. Iso 434 TaxID=3062272 RepID=UPI0039818D93